jgi:protein kinase C substrate 80K-H
VPFSNVNDGVCDYELCCDGSDEWEGLGAAKCENKCKEIGKEWKKQDDQRQKSMGVASKRRKELVLEAVRLKKQVEERVVILDVEIRAAEIKVGDLEKALSEVERREKGRVVKGPSKGSRVNVLAALAKGRVEELRGSLSDVRGQRDDAKNKVRDLELILSTFKEEYNPNFNDEGVKRAVKAWEDYAATKGSAGEEGSGAIERDLEEILKPDGEEHGIKWEEWEAEDASDVDVCKYTLRLVQGSSNSEISV